MTDSARFLWHVQKGGQQIGPLTPQALRQMADAGMIDPTDMVWREGLADWVAAHKVAGLFAAPPKSPPPPPPPPPPSPMGARGQAPQAFYAQPQPQPRQHVAPVSAPVVNQSYEVPPDAIEAGAMVEDVPARPVAMPTRTERSRTIFLLVVASFCLVSLALPWAYMWISGPQGSALLFLPKSEAVQYSTMPPSGILLWGFESSWPFVLLPFALLGLATAITELAMPRFPLVRAITRWIHVGIYSALLIITFIGVLLTGFDWHGFSRSLYASASAVDSGNSDLAQVHCFGIPLASVLLLGLLVPAVVTAIKGCGKPVRKQPSAQARQQAAAALERL